mgnify:CR=1 FL=1
MTEKVLNRTVESELMTEKQEEDHKKKESKRQMDNYYYLKSLGVCPKCGREDAFPGHVYCPSCLEKQQKKSRDYYHRLSAKDKELRHKKASKRHKELYQQRKAEGLCVACGKKAVKGVFCLECYAKNKKRNWERAQKKKIETGGNPMDLRVEKGLCRFCEEPALPGHRLCEKHYATAVETARHARQFNHYWREENQLLFNKKGSQSNVLTEGDK